MYYYRHANGGLMALKERNKSPDLTEITEEEFKASKPRDIVYSPEEVEKAKALAEAYEYLNSTDFKVIKYVEGNISEEEFQVIKAKRAEARAIINNYEKGA